MSDMVDRMLTYIAEETTGPTLRSKTHSERKDKHFFVKASRVFVGATVAALCGRTQERNRLLEVVGERLHWIESTFSGFWWCRAILEETQSQTNISGSLQEIFSLLIRYRNGGSDCSSLLLTKPTSELYQFAGGFWLIDLGVTLLPVSFIVFYHGVLLVRQATTRKRVHINNSASASSWENHSLSYVGNMRPFYGERWVCCDEDRSRATALDVWMLLILLASEQWHRLVLFADTHTHTHTQ